MKSRNGTSSDLFILPFIFLFRLALAFMQELAKNDEAGEKEENQKEGVNRQPSENIGNI